jgi:hypothetical protein
MKKTISTYWPVAMLVPLVLAGYCHAIHPMAGAAHPQNAETVSAEFARAISLGLVDSDSSVPANSPSVAVSQTF